jgi:threonine synthase
MNYYSTNRHSPVVGFKEATVLGQAPDKGLYFPESIPMLPAYFFKEIETLSREEIAFRVISPYVGDAIPEAELRRIAAETVDFDFPLVKVSDTISSLELFHGPTLAFKDVGARFMSRCLGYFSKERSDTVYVLVATSGDTGGAVANGFHNVEGVEVIILYPSGKVSAVQEKQLTTLGGNIHALEVDGSFDDCQKMVKRAFADEELTNQLFLTSANSINVARWLPQQFYYFYAWQQWKQKNAPPVIAVPSGNFGNICAGLVACRSGLPAKHFIAACNANNAVPEYFRKGEYTPQPAKATMSNAMDVGDPSNFVRMLEIFDHQYGELKEFITAYSITDAETAKTITEVNEKFNYLPDPHGAVAYAALKKYLEENNADEGIFLETAHPVKFYDVVEPLVNSKIPVPDSVKQILNKKKSSKKISNQYQDLRDYLIE